MTVLLVLAVNGVLLGAYLTAHARLRARGDAWPAGRVLAFATGCTAVPVALVVPLPGAEFTAHLEQHLLIGMAAPVLLVVARPLTLALRSLPTGYLRRRLLVTAHSRVAAAVMYPPLIGVLEAGGPWLLYRTRLFAVSDDRPWLHALVHLHMLVTGVLFSAAVCQLDPLRHRYPLVLRAATLIGAAAAHGVLAKPMSVAGPPGTGFAAADLARGAELMSYGGDLVEVVLAVVICRQWHALSGKEWARSLRRTASAGERGGVTCPDDVTR